MVGHVERVGKCIKFLPQKSKQKKKFSPVYNIKMFVVAVECRNEYLISDYPNGAQ
jgi:hypothetical protein